MSNNADITNGFIAAWCALDLEGIMAYFTDDAVYTNIPMGPPNVGKADIRAFIEGFIGTALEINFVVHNQVEGADGIVMGCFGGAGEVEGKEGGVGLKVVFQETDPRGGAV